MHEWWPAESTNLRPSPSARRGVELSRGITRFRRREQHIAASSASPHPHPPPGEQPCLVSSDFYFVVPSVTMFYHRIEDCQQLAHAGHHGDLVGLAVAAQALVKSANDRVVDPRGEGGHEHNGAHLTPATPGSAAAVK